MDSSKRKRAPGAALAARFAVLAATAGSIGGCCSDRDITLCVDALESTTCPPSEVIAETVSGSDTIVKSSGTFWPAHDYQINGVLMTEPAQCCYEATQTLCTEEFN